MNNYFKTIFHSLNEIENEYEYESSLLFLIHYELNYIEINNNIKIYDKHYNNIYTLYHKAEKKILFLLSSDSVNFYSSKEELIYNNIFLFKETKKIIKFFHQRIFFNFTIDYRKSNFFAQYFNGFILKNIPLIGFIIKENIKLPKILLVKFIKYSMKNYINFPIIKFIILNLKDDFIDNKIISFCYCNNIHILYSINETEYLFKSMIC